MKIPDTQTVFHSYLTLHMIDDRMTLLDPVEELCLFASKETLARCSPPIPMITGGRDRLVGEGVLLFRQWHHGNSAVTVCLAVAGSRLMQFILKVPEKSVPEFNVEIHGWVPTNFSQSSVQYIIQKLKKNDKHAYFSGRAAEILS
ncbi:hypothetical protein ILYODFUR_033573 [Ilyodon furcidens]|uniref:Uncharacterized protein n=1 Tax=Ilyodon furcidens TaxID=33524 RepID=A0ABV0UMP7_9TELE